MNTLEGIFRQAIRMTPLIMVPLLFLSGCTGYPANPYGEIEMDEWCDRDDRKPWTGCWEEVKQIDCESSEDYEPEDTIGEFRLRSDGVYSVTRHPFEHFVDYAGTYSVTETNGTIAFSPIDTPGFRGEGAYSFRENGDLVLRDIWFGVFSGSDGSESVPPDVPCGYVFRRK